MLNPEEEPAGSLSAATAPIPTVPLIPIPVTAEEDWPHSTAHADQAAPAAPAAPPRFFSQEEDEKVEVAVAEDEPEEPNFFSASSPLRPVERAERAEPVDAIDMVEEHEVQEATVEQPVAYDAPAAYEAEELVAAPARPKFAELSEEPAYTPLPRDYAKEFASAHGPAPVDDTHAYPAATLFRESDDEAGHDLEKPAFLRRLGFKS
jgi:hypothetical protein